MNFSPLCKSHNKLRRKGRKQKSRVCPPYKNYPSFLIFFLTLCRDSTSLKPAGFSVHTGDSQLPHAHEYLTHNL